jgi:hypothetical protein
MLSIRDVAACNHGDNSGDRRFGLTWRPGMVPSVPVVRKIQMIINDLALIEVDA